MNVDDFLLELSAGIYGAQNMHLFKPEAASFSLQRRRACTLVVFFPYLRSMNLPSICFLCISVVNDRL